MDAITSFSGKHDFLSNFYPCHMMYDGILYRAVEHAYQAHKSLDINERRRFAHIFHPAQAKKDGKKIILRDDWEQVKLKIMKELLVIKFNQEPFKTKLIETGSAELIESNWWGDRYWGVCKGVGENMLGKLLMQIRNEMVDTLR